METITLCAVYLYIHGPLDINWSNMFHGIVIPVLTYVVLIENIFTSVLI